MLRDSVTVVLTCPRAMPPAMINMRKSTHGFPFLSHDKHEKINSWVSFSFPYAYGAPLGGPSVSNCLDRSAVNISFAIIAHFGMSLFHDAHVVMRSFPVGSAI